MPRFFVLLALASVVAAQGRTVDAVVAEHVAALGAAAKVKTLRTSSKVSVSKQPTQGMRAEWRLPGECRREIAVPRGKLAWREFYGRDGAFVSNMGLLERLRPNQVTTRGGFYFYKALADPFPLLAYSRDNAARATLKLGMTEVKGVRHEVLFTPKDAHGVRAVFILHPETKLIYNVRYEAEENKPLASVAYESYRMVDGVALPHRVVGYPEMAYEDSATRRLQYKRPVRTELDIVWEVNADLGRASFTPPGLPRRAPDGEGFERAVYGTGPDPHELALGDLDGDGRTDIAVACEGGVYVHFGGAEDKPVRVPLGYGHHRGMAIDDLDVDGRLELITTSNLPAQRFFVVGFDRARKATARGMFGAPIFAHTLKTDDLDCDGIPDIIVTGYGSADLQIKFGNGHGGLRLVGSPWPLDVKAGTRRGLGLAVGDLDGDRMRDIAVADTFRVVFFRGQTNLSFQPRLALPPKDEEKSGWFPYALAFADLDRDGRDDLVVGRSNRLRDLRGDVQVVHNRAGARQSTLEVKPPIEIGARVESVGVGRFDGDEFLDIAATSLLTGELVVLLNDGAGGFSRKRVSKFVSGRGAARLAVGHYDGDGIHDIVVANRLADTVAIFRGTRGRAGPRLPPLRATPVPLRPAAKKFALEGLSAPFEFVGEFLLPPGLMCPSGIACLGGVTSSQFVLVSDKKSAFYRGVLDRAGKRFLVGPPVPLAGLGHETLDLESVAFDGWTGTFFFAAERDNSIIRTTIFGEVLGRAKTAIPVNPAFGIEAMVLRRKLDGTPLVYALQEMAGMIHAYDVADPLVLEPRRTDLRGAGDQTGAALLGPNLLVVSRLASTITEYEFDAADGLRKRPRLANFGAVVRALGLQYSDKPFANVEGVAVDPHGDLFLVIDHQNQELGVAGKNRARCGRLLWFRNVGPKRPRAEARRVRIKHIHIPCAGAREAPAKLELDKAGAAAIAQEVVRRLEAGEDFDQIAAERHYTKSRYPIVFNIIEGNVTPKRGELKRKDVPIAFARLAFGLEPGQAGICEYESEESPYGYHVILRIE